MFISLVDKSKQYVSFKQTFDDSIKKLYREKAKDISFGEFFSCSFNRMMLRPKRCSLSKMVPLVIAFALLFSNPTLQIYGFLPTKNRIIQDYLMISAKQQQLIIKSVAPYIILECLQHIDKYFNLAEFLIKMCRISAFY